MPAAEERQSEPTVLRVAHLSSALRRFVDSALVSDPREGVEVGLEIENAALAADAVRSARRLRAAEPAERELAGSAALKAHAASNVGEGLETAPSEALEAFSGCGVRFHEEQYASGLTGTQEENDSSP